MNRDKITAAIVQHENAFDDGMTIIEENASASWRDQGLKLAAQSAAILGELRHRLAIIDGKDPAAACAFVWNAQNVEMLREMWAKGYSAMEIAGTLGGGITRNAVIGKANRMGLQNRRSPIKGSKS